MNDVLMVDDHSDEKSVLSSSNNLKLHVTRDNLIAAQQDDFTLHNFFSFVVSPEVAQGRKAVFSWRMEF